MEGTAMTEPKRVVFTGYDDSVMRDQLKRMSDAGRLTVDAKGAVWLKRVVEPVAAATRASLDDAAVMACVPWDKGPSDPHR